MIEVEHLLCVAAQLANVQHQFHVWIDQPAKVRFISRCHLGYALELLTIRIGLCLAAVVVAQKGRLATDGVTLVFPVRQCKSVFSHVMELDLANQAAEIAPDNAGHRRATPPGLVVSFSRMHDCRIVETSTSPPGWRARSQRHVDCSMFQRPSGHSRPSQPPLVVPRDTEMVGGAGQGVMLNIMLCAIC